MNLSRLRLWSYRL